MMPGLATSVCFSLEFTIAKTRTHFDHTKEKFSYKHVTGIELLLCFYQVPDFILKI